MLKFCLNGNVPSNLWKFLKPALAFDLASSFLTPNRITTFKAPPLMSLFILRNTPVFVSRILATFSFLLLPSNLPKWPSLKSCSLSFIFLLLLFLVEILVKPLLYTSFIVADVHAILEKIVYFEFTQLNSLPVAFHCRNSSLISSSYM